MKQIWLNGALLASDVAGIAPNDRGLLLGDGLFETLAVRNHVVRNFDKHLDRLRQGCSLLLIPFPKADLRDAIDRTLRANQMSDAGVRLTLTRGPGERCLAPSLPGNNLEATLIISLFELPQPLDPARCIIAKTTCRNEKSLLSRIKSLNYLDSILARMEADQMGADDALLLNTKGMVAEATTSNVFAVIKNRIVTPPIADGALPGTRRAALIDFLGANEQSLSINDIMDADEVFLSNALSLRTMASVNGHRIGPGSEGAVIKKIRLELN